MAKNKIGPVLSLYPMPTVLVGANVNGKPNFITIAHVGIIDFKTISLSMGKTHYTNSGIRENKTFSVNLPSEDLVAETDYCGIMTGKNTDKGSMFETFYGTLETAPMIRKCPVNMECRLVQIVDMPRNDVFLGEIVETYCDEPFMTGGEPDAAKIRPILFAMGGRGYFRMGPRLADAWNIGKTLKG